MARTISISDDEFYRVVKNTAAVQTRTIDEQAIHWMKIGKAIEESTNFNYAHIKQALTAQRSVDDLTVEEQAVFMENFYQAINGNLEKDFEKHFNSLESAGKLYGMSENGKIIASK